jgi:NADP-dependent aldehyde dehydrogenase
MALHGKNLIGNDTSASGEATFRAINPATTEALEPAFTEATNLEINRALEKAEGAFRAYRQKSPAEIADFLDKIADEIVELGDELIERAVAETGLPAGRITGERGRTVGQLKMFAGVVREGSWVNARIDTALPDREPVPKPDLRYMLIARGPVVVFGASNFPLAFSVAGGDTASALAAGCTVVVKAHPAHPGTSELVGNAINAAAVATDMPPGAFSLVQGITNRVGEQLVKHRFTQAVGFTGSLAGGLALFDIAMARPEPIPVYAEMGSTNPVFILPGAMAERADAIAVGLTQSVTLGVGQFCTNPGLVVTLADDTAKQFESKLGDCIKAAPCGTMLHGGILAGYTAGVEELSKVESVELTARSEAEADATKTQAQAALFTTSGQTFINEPQLENEIFGPSTLLVQCDTPEKMEQVARNFEGHLTATILGTEEDIETYQSLVRLLERKVGRLIFNGYPTGVDVCPSMHHGGPYPATTDANFTSVGTAAINRFARPLTYQNFPQAALPLQLRDENECGISRLVNSTFTRDSIG